MAGLAGCPAPADRDDIITLIAETRVCVLPRAAAWLRARQGELRRVRPQVAEGIADAQVTLVYEILQMEMPDKFVERPYMCSKPERPHDWDDWWLHRDD
eukprot:scaffold358438_cov44-Prasinocladus_malaysianus.AAC.3